MVEEVILVDEQDEVVGSAEKLAAHQKGLLHRAISVLIFNDQGQLMLQKRASHKYHSPSLWTNTCCSHPRPGEESIDAAQRRLIEEMGMNVELKHDHHFIYKIQFENGLWEYELDHVFVGYSNSPPSVNYMEASDWRWADLDEIRSELVKSPEDYTFWFRILFNKLMDTNSMI